MHCTNCGTELGTDAMFCSSCGRSLADNAVTPAKKRDWELHITVLGWLVIAHAAMTAVIGLIVMFGGQIAGNIIHNNPQLLANADPDVPPAEVLVSIIGPVTFLVGVLLMVISMPSIAAGVGLLRYRSWGRALTLILSVLRLLEFPLGTLTAIYSFWVLLSEGGKTFFKERAARAEV